MRARQRLMPRNESVLDGGEGEPASEPWWGCHWCLGSDSRS